MQVAMLRPGAVLGAYPELDPDAAADDAPSNAMWRYPRALSRRALVRFVSLVHEHAATFREQAPQAMGAHIDELRAALVAEGITDVLAARCFALTQAISTHQLGLRHYDTQLVAGRVMLGGAVAQMHTGEGKTLAATLPVCTAALAGIPVHVITANDYLATRDAAAMGPVYRALGLSVGAVTAETPPTQRRAAYARDIIYTTSKQLAFDYLRDRLTLGERRGAANLKTERLYNPSPRTDNVILRGLCFAIVDEADSVLIDEASTPFVIARDVDAGDLQAHCNAALEAAASLVEPRDFHLDVTRHRVSLTGAGRERVQRKAKSVPGSQRQREALIEQALAARLLYRAERDYLVRDGKIQIIDRHTGRVLADRSWERGLHQMIECIEGCGVTAPRETLASLTFQRLFPRYLHLAGMTGTAQEVAGELWSTYQLPVVTIPTNEPCQRHAHPLHLARARDDKLEAIVAAVAREHARRRPVLIGTRTVEDSQALSALLDAAGLPHQLLNARQDAHEASIVARAGQVGQITVATNMAGRGTDIALGPGVQELGGLHVIVSEPNDARRLDRQLFGRCARHGEPGSWQMFACGEDDVIKRYGLPLTPAILRKADGAGGPGRLMSSGLIRYAQRRCELHQRATRVGLRKIQSTYDKLLAFAGQRN